MKHPTNEPKQDTAHDVLRRHHKTINTAAKILETVSVDIKDRMERTGNRPIGWPDVSAVAKITELAAELIKGWDE